MRIEEIWELPVDLRFEALVQRWEDLEEHTGNRTPAQIREMLEIADAILPALIRHWEKGEEVFRKLEDERTKHLWIPVAERLPDPGTGWVLACDKDGNHSVVWANPDEGLMELIGYAEYERSTATHWMPLPEPPETK